MESNEEKITRLEATIRTMTNDIATMKDDFNTRIEALHQLINDYDTKTVVNVEKLNKDLSNIANKQTPTDTTATTRSNTVELPMPTFEGNEQTDHPKRFLRNLNTYLIHKKIAEDDKMIVIENCLKGKAAKWFTMVKDATCNIENFKDLFLKNFFSENKQWSIFIKCTEAGKATTKGNYQEHFHKWMDELKYLDSPKIAEEQAINLVIKHFPIAIQAYIQNTEKTFLKIWEKLGEIDEKDQQVDPSPKQKTTYTYHQNRNTNQTPHTQSYGRQNFQNDRKNAEKTVNQITIVQDQAKNSEEETDDEMPQNWTRETGEDQPPSLNPTDPEYTE